MAIKISRSPNYVLGQSFKISGNPAAGGVGIGKNFSGGGMTYPNPFCQADTRPATEFSVAGMAVGDVRTVRGEWSSASPLSVSAPLFTDPSKDSCYAKYFVATGIQAWDRYKIEMASDVDAVDPVSGDPVPVMFYVKKGACSDYTPGVWSLMDTSQRIYSNELNSYTNAVYPDYFTPIATDNYGIECVALQNNTPGYFQLKITRLVNSLSQVYLSTNGGSPEPLSALDSGEMSLNLSTVQSWILSTDNDSAYLVKLNSEALYNFDTQQYEQPTHALPFDIAAHYNQTANPSSDIIVIIDPASGDVLFQMNFPSAAIINGSFSSSAYLKIGNGSYSDIGYILNTWGNNNTQYNINDIGNGIDVTTTNIYFRMGYWQDTTANYHIKFDNDASNTYRPVTIGEDYNLSTYFNSLESFSNGGVESFRVYRQTGVDTFEQIGSVFVLRGLMGISGGYVPPVFKATYSRAGESDVVVTDFTSSVTLTTSLDVSSGNQATFTLSNFVLSPYSYYKLKFENDATYVDLADGVAFNISQYYMNLGSIPSGGTDSFKIYYGVPVPDPSDPKGKPTLDYSPFAGTFNLSGLTGI